MKKTVDFTFKDVEYVISDYSKPDIQQDAQNEYNRVFGEAVKSGALLRKTLDKVVKEQGLISDETEEKEKELTKQLSDNTQQLLSGGIYLSDGYKLAIKNRELRVELLELQTEFIDMNKLTAEGQAEQARFDFLFVRSFKNKADDTLVYVDMEAHAEHKTSDLCVYASNQFAELGWPLQADYEKKLPENEFLINYGFVDDDLRLVNKEGHLIDTAGQLINEDGYLVNDEDKMLSIGGEVLKEDGTFDINFKPFLNEDGKDVDVKKEEEIVEQETVLTE